MQRKSPEKSVDFLARNTASDSHRFPEAGIFDPEQLNSDKAKAFD
jgi:hypothetical protein